jgi:hypothetical protein
VAVGVCLAGCDLRDASGPAGSGASGPVEKASASGAKDSPESVARAAGAAQQRGDWHGVFSCYTPESIDMLLGIYVEEALQQRNLAALLPGAEVRMQPLADAFAKHCLDAASWDSVPKGGATPERSAALKALAARVSDKVACAADVMNALKTMEKSAGTNGPVTAMQLPTEFELRNVRIAGDAAEANSVSKVEGQEHVFPIKFRRTAGGWKIDLAATMQVP